VATNTDVYGVTTSLVTGQQASPTSSLNRQSAGQGQGQPTPFTNRQAAKNAADPSRKLQAEIDELEDRLRERDNTIKTFEQQKRVHKVQLDRKGDEILEL
jgi:TolA-binding protein